jgi:23S rRNA (pseudouridine1915-N3)-methyltransferase
MMRYARAMQLTLAHIGPKSPAEWAVLTDEYIRRMGAYVEAGTQAFKSEAALVEWLGRQKSAAMLVLLDSRGKMLSSEGLAEFIGGQRERGARHLVFAIGPANGWSKAVMEPVSGVRPMMISLGPMTLAHALARVVLAEQLYRAFTILAGHPYHSGH